AHGDAVHLPAGAELRLRRRRGHGGLRAHLPRGRRRDADGDDVREPGPDDRGGGEDSRRAGFPVSAGPGSGVGGRGSGRLACSSGPRTPVPGSRIHGGIAMRLGRIGYVNCYPVYGAMDRGIVAAPATLVTGTPNELNDRLVDGRLDVSVISAVAYAQHASEMELLPELAISSDGPVRSVLLLGRRPPQDLDGARVLVSASSRTSVLLLEELARDRWQA